MDDSFSLGKPARRRSAPPSRRPDRIGPGAGATGSPVMVVAMVVGGILVAGAIVAFMLLMKSGGEQAASADATAIAQIGVAKDVQAKLTATQVAAAVQQLAAEQGSFGGVDPGSLTTFEPSFSYTAGPSTGPNQASVAATSSGVGIAVASASGTCFYVFDGGAGVRYGTGTPCTGQAAAAASASAWPNE
jgi:hypothetical protein